MREPIPAIAAHDYEPVLVPLNFVLSGEVGLSERQAAHDATAEYVAKIGKICSSATIHFEIEEYPSRKEKMFSGIIRLIDKDISSQELDGSLLLLGQTIRSARQEIDRPQRWLATKIEATPAYIGILEKGSNPKTQRPSRPSLEKLWAISEVLDLDIDELLDLAGYEIEESGR